VRANLGTSVLRKPATGVQHVSTPTFEHDDGRRIGVDRSKHLKLTRTA
jgi:hypothetical protein